MFFVWSKCFKLSQCVRMSIKHPLWAVHVACTKRYTWTCNNLFFFLKYVDHIDNNKRREYEVKLVKVHDSVSECVYLCVRFPHYVEEYDEKRCLFLQLAFQ